MTNRVKPTRPLRPVTTRDGYVPTPNPKSGYQPPTGKGAPSKPPSNAPNKSSGGKK